MSSLFEELDDDARQAPVSPRREMGAYEALWLKRGATFRRLALRFAKDPAARPSDLVPPEEADACAGQAQDILEAAGVEDFGVCVHGAPDYPRRLRDARYPVELLYYRGNLDLTRTRSVAVIGSRDSSPEGEEHAAQLAREIAGRGWAVASGLAAGIDTAAHRAALEAGGSTVAVIGTALGSVYPRENAELQEEIATEHLLVSQIPIILFNRQDWRRNRAFFPERNATMSALASATVIVEAGETSGALIQARAALHQGRRLLVLGSCFGKGLMWPEQLVRRGARRLQDAREIWSHVDDQMASEEDRPFPGRRSQSHQKC